jgi:hypothetical protein
LQIPTRENSRYSVPLILKNQTQPSAAIDAPVQDVNVIVSPLIKPIIIFVKETFFRFVRLNAVIAQMLNVAILFVLIIPFKLIPARFSHGLFLIQRCD